jgi:hypothetical protein
MFCLNFQAATIIYNEKRAQKTLKYAMIHCGNAERAAAAALVQRLQKFIRIEYFFAL